MNKKNLWKRPGIAEIQIGLEDLRKTVLNSTYEEFNPNNTAKALMILENIIERSNYSIDERLLSKKYKQLSQIDPRELNLSKKQKVILKKHPELVHHLYNISIEIATSHNLYGINCMSNTEEKINAFRVATNIRIKTALAYLETGNYPEAISQIQSAFNKLETLYIENTDKSKENKFDLGRYKSLTEFIDMLLEEHELKNDALEDKSSRPSKTFKCTLDPKLLKSYNISYVPLRANREIKQSEQLRKIELPKLEQIFQDYHDFGIPYYSKATH